jgi:hypothetical protein
MAGTAGSMGAIWVQAATIRQGKAGWRGGWAQGTRWARAWLLTRGLEGEYMGPRSVYSWDMASDTGGLEPAVCPKGGRGT